MAQTPWRDLGSVDILSAHVSGLQHAVGKIEQVLNMRTASVTGHVLTPVTDQDDPALRYRIYEGSVRNWLEDPAPVIYRDGQVVSPSEYAIYPAYGAVVFHQPQAANAQITADFTCITAQSQTLDWLKQTSAFGFQRVGAWRANNVGSGTLGSYATAANVLDVILFPVPFRMSFDRIGVNVATAASGTSVRLGVYADRGDIYPGALVLDAGEIGTDVSGVRAIPISLTLEPGLYWLARLQNGTPSIRGFPSDSTLGFGIDDSLVGSPATAWRVNLAYGPLPNPYPEGGIMRFGAMPAVWLRRSA